MLLPQNVASLVVWLCIIASATAQRKRSRVLCSRPDVVPNGSLQIRRGGNLLRIFCNFGYTQLGPRAIPCVHGKWYGEKPICARKGCKTDLTPPAHGRLQYENLQKITLLCSDTHELAGNRHAYCNGTDWDRPIGNCRQQKLTVDHECDFETEDACGWVFERTESYEWKRVTATNMFTSFRTGPRHDHTTMSSSGGHYMLMESFGPTVVPVTLSSPIYDQELSLKTACCFQFFYFMYGSGVGKLSVLVKPASVNSTQMIKDQDKYVKFEKTGSQNNLWNEGKFDINEMSEDFQIVFLVTGGKSHLSDVAIDDVKLMIGTECRPGGKKTETPIDLEDYETTTDVALIDTQSCVSRCGEASGMGLFRKNEGFFGLCNCHVDCLLDDSCCPDYKSACLSDNDETTVEAEPTEVATGRPTPLPRIGTVQGKTTTEATTATTTTTTIVTTPTTTTTRKVPPIKPTRTTTTTTTITTTTTKKPTTTSTTTTTTTTKKPTTTSTITTTTTKKLLTIKPTTTTTTTTTTRKPTSPRAIPTVTTPKLVKPTAKPPTTTTAAKASSGQKISPTEPTVPHVEVSEKENNKNNRTTVFVNASTAKSAPNAVNGKGIMKAVLIGISAGILILAIAYRYKSKVTGFYARRLRKGSTANRGDEDGTSIIANFQPNTSRENGHPANRTDGGQKDVTFRKASSERKTKRDHSESTSVVDFDDADDDDGIPLL